MHILDCVASASLLINSGVAPYCSNNGSSLKSLFIIALRSLVVVFDSELSIEDYIYSLMGLIRQFTSPSLIT